MAFVDKNLVPAVKHGRIIIFATDGKSKILRIDGTMDYDRFKAILNENILHLVLNLGLVRGYIFPRDQDQNYHSKTTKESVGKRDFVSWDD